MRNRKKPREATRVILTETSVKISATVYIVKLREFCCKTKKKGRECPGHFQRNHDRHSQ